MRLAIYVRVSTDEQREGQTIDSQVSELEHFATEKSWLIAGIYKDDGWSGAVMDRPELDRLRDDARQGLFQAVLINDVDRLARDVAHLGIIKRDLERQGIQVIFRKLPSEASPTYNLMVNVLGSFAEFERELIADRTRRGRRHKVEVRHQYLGSSAAYGYRYIPADASSGRSGYLELVPHEAEVVQKMFAWVDEEGLSGRGVIRRLGEHQIKPRSGSVTWGKSSVLAVLRNEMYAGVWHFNKHRACEPLKPTTDLKYRKHLKTSNRRRPKHDWIPLQLPEELTIVARTRWERVQKQLDRNITFSPRNEKHSYLLKGLVECGACHARYVGNPDRGRFYYRCLARCKRIPTIREETLNDAVWSLVVTAMLNPKLISDQVNELRQSDESGLAEMQAEKRSLEKAVEELQAEETRIIEAYRLGVLSPLQLGNELQGLKSRRKILDVQQSETAVLPVPILKKTVAQFCDEAATNLSTFTTAERQLFLRTLLRRVVFEGKLARIEGVIPNEYVEQAVGHTADGELFVGGGTATTAVSRHGRNPVIRFTLATEVVKNTNAPEESSNTAARPGRDDHTVIAKPSGRRPSRRHLRGISSGLAAQKMPYTPRPSRNA